MFKETLSKIKYEKKDIKSFSRLVGGIFLALGGLFLWRDKHTFLCPYFFGIGGFLVVVGEVYYPLLKPVYKGWMFFSVCLGFVMSRVILTILFFFILTPISLLARIVGKKFIDKSFRSDVESYWIRREETPTIESYENQY